MGWFYRAVLIGVLALAGCGGGGDRAQPTPDTVGSAARGPGGMGPGPRSDSMMRMSPDRMRAHADSMRRMSPEERRAFMARHKQMMSRMRVAADSGWRALRDSLKTDLAELPKLQGAELTARLREHAARVERLLTMQEQVMGQ